MFLASPLRRMTGLYLKLDSRENLPGMEYFLKETIFFSLFTSLRDVKKKKASPSQGRWLRTDPTGPFKFHSPKSAKIRKSRFGSRRKNTLDFQFPGRWSLLSSSLGVPAERELGRSVFQVAHMESAVWPHLFGPWFAHVRTRPLF